MRDGATAGPQGASSERQQILDEIVDLRAAQVGRSVVSVGRVALGQKLLQAGARAIVQEGGRSPALHQRGRVKEGLSLIETACGSDIVSLEVGEQATGVADCAARFRTSKHGFPAAGRRREPALFELRAGQWHQRPQVAVQRGCHILALDGIERQPKPQDEGARRESSPRSSLLEGLA